MSQPAVNATSMEQLIVVIQQLSLARDLETIATIVRHHARALTGADGATFVLKEGDQSYYLDEEAISPLWKGKRFPLTSCISGWAMLNKQSVVISDITQDERIPQDAYRPTFVKSLVMVPVRTAAPIAAIGNYWAVERDPTPEEIKLLQTLADSTSIAMENVTLYSDLKNQVLEKEALLREVYHRVKNNLQVISSLLNLQADSESNMTSQQSLLKSAARIKSMALVHETLYQSDSLAEIDMTNYLRNLFRYFREIYHSSAQEIQFSKDVDPILLGIDMAVPCGLIINELISNAYNHAFRVIKPPVK